jgi:hypothetical protein
MPTFTVHAPRSGTRANPERFVFVRDGFHFWAFALAPVWLIVHRLWLALFGYIAVNAVVGGALYLLGVQELARFFSGLVIALLVGFEAATLQRWTLERRGWKTLGFAVGEDLESAEQRFFSAWSRNAAARRPESAPPPQQLAAPVWRGKPPPPDIIGLFPEPERKQ